MARIPSKPKSASKKTAARASGKKQRAPRKDQLLSGSLKDRLKNIVDGLVNNELEEWIKDGAEEESKLKAAKITVDLMEFVQPKLTRVVMSEEESKALAKGVGAELRKQIAKRMLDATPTGDDE